MLFVEPTDDNPAGVIPESKEDCILLLELALEEITRLNDLLQKFYSL